MSEVIHQPDPDNPEDVSEAAQRLGMHSARSIPKAFFGVNERVFHRMTGGATEELVSHEVGNIGREIDNGEQPWARRLTIDNVWQEVDFGWAAKKDGQRVTPSHLVIVNLEGKFTQSRPTPEEQAKADARVVEIACRDEVAAGTEPPPLSRFAIVRPFFSARIEPVKGVEYYYRCRTDEAKVLVVAIPGD